MNIAGSTIQPLVLSRPRRHGGERISSEYPSSISLPCSLRANDADRDVEISRVTVRSSASAMPPKSASLCRRPSTAVFLTPQPLFFARSSEAEREAPLQCGGFAGRIFAASVPRSGIDRAELCRAGCSMAFRGRMMLDFGNWVMLDLGRQRSDMRSATASWHARPNRRSRLTRRGCARRAREDYYSAATAWSRTGCSALLRARHLDLPDDYCQDPSFASRSTQLRLLHYPPQPVDSDAEGVEAHTDTGAFTILLQDQVGGLDDAQPRGRWISARPIQGSLVINIADMMQRWTSGRFVLGTAPRRQSHRPGPHLRAVLRQSRL